MEIWKLKRQGCSIRAIARRLGIHRTTVEKYLRNKEFPKYEAVERKSGLMPYYQMIADRLSNSRGYETVKRYVRMLKEKRDRIAYLRFETLPGQQAQVDFADFQIVSGNGDVFALYVFVMVLGYSRQMYIEFINRSTMTTFLDCNQNAFRFLGGVPQEILYSPCGGGPCLSS